MKNSNHIGIKGHDVTSKVQLKCFNASALIEELANIGTTIQNIILKKVTELKSYAMSVISHITPEKRSKISKSNPLYRWKIRLQNPAIALDLNNRSYLSTPEKDSDLHATKSRSVNRKEGRQLTGKIDTPTRVGMHSLNTASNANTKPTLTQMMDNMNMRNVSNSENYPYVIGESHHMSHSLLDDTDYPNRSQEIIKHNHILSTNPIAHRCKLFAQTVPKNERYLSFETDDKAADLVQNNLKRNNSTEITQGLSKTLKHLNYQREPYKTENLPAFEELSTLCALRQVSSRVNTTCQLAARSHCSRWLPVIALLFVMTATAQMVRK